MAKLAGDRMYQALRENSVKIGDSLTLPGVKTVASWMFSKGALTFNEMDSIQKREDLISVVLRKANDSTALSDLMTAFVAGLREAEAYGWADEIELKGKRGAPNIKEDTSTVSCCADQKPGHKTCDTVDAAPVPKRRREPYPLGKGRAIIIYIAKFVSVSGTLVGENDAPGNEVDGKSLEEFFKKKCGFFVETIHNKDATRSEIIGRLNDVARESNADYTMFVCAVLSHGGINGENKCYVHDYRWNELLVEEITDPFKKATSLASKPKVFIFNACRGTKFEGFHTLSAGLQLESTECVPYRMCVPREADFLYFYSSVEGYYSLTKDHGSDFVTKLLSTLEEESGLDVVAAFTDVIDQMTKIGKVSVAKGKDAAGNKITENEVVPTPCIVSTLTKALYFR